MNIVQDAMNASLPGTAKQFYAGLQPKAMGEMIMYVAIIALLPLIGNLIGGLVWSGLLYGIVYGIMSYIGMILGVVVTGIVLAAVSKGIVGRQISNEEGVTIIGFIVTPLMIVGFLTGLLTALGFAGIMIAGLVGLLALVYVFILLYWAGEARYGKDKAIVFAIMVVVIWFVISLLIGLITSIVYLGAGGSIPGTPLGGTTYGPGYGGCTKWGTGPGGPYCVY